MEYGGKWDSILDSQDPWNPRLELNWYHRLMSICWLVMMNPNDIPS